MKKIITLGIVLMISWAELLSMGPPYGVESIEHLPPANELVEYFTYDVEVEPIEPTNLCEAIRQGKTGHIDKFIEEEEQLETTDRCGNTPLLLTFTSPRILNHTLLAKRLLEKGANMFAQNHNGDNALMLAAQKLDIEFIKLLFARGFIDLYHSNRSGTTLLIAVAEVKAISKSAKYLRDAIIRLLLKMAVTTEKNALYFLCCLQRTYPTVYNLAWVFDPYLKDSYHISLKKLLTATDNAKKTAHDYCALEDLAVEKMEQTRAQYNPFAKKCGHCGKASSERTTLKRYGRCKCVYYCSAECQKKDWRTTHKNSCQPG